MRRNILLAIAFIVLSSSALAFDRYSYNFQDFGLPSKSLKILQLGQKVTNGIYNFQCVIDNPNYQNKNPISIDIYYKADPRTKSRLLLNNKMTNFFQVVQINNKGFSNQMFFQNVEGKTIYDGVYVRSCKLMLITNN